MIKKRLTMPTLIVAAACVVVATGAIVMLRTAHANTTKKEAAAEFKMATSTIDHVTVYQHNALVTRIVDVPAGTGTMELVVSPLPAQTVDTSLYSEGSEGARVLTTRFRVRPVKEDTREEVRKTETQLKQLLEDGQKIQSEIKTLEDNLKMIGKLEGFTAANVTAATEKGKLDADQITNLSDYVMKQRGDKAKELVTLQQKLLKNGEQMEFLRRQLKELTAGTSKVERDAVIVVNKTNAAPRTVKLNYLVSAVAWRPQYRFRAGKGENDPVRIEYLAGVVQQTGEEWNNVKLTLSTAQPMLNAAPPNLRTLGVMLMPRDPNAMAGALGQLGQLGVGGGQFGFAGQLGALGALGGQGAPIDNPLPNPPVDLQQEVAKETQKLRQQAQESYSNRDSESGSRLTNDAAALEQANEILVLEKEDLASRRTRANALAGQSVTYHLTNKLSVPSRNEEHVIEMTRLEMKPDFCYKAIPVLTRHVYRLANLTNNTDYVLLPGEATMYNGDDFVGRMDAPLVAIGEQFTAGFGVDPQLQVVREMMDKQRTQQGGNQVIKYDYRILVSSYKTKPVKMQVWERLPRSETETFGVTLLKTTPELCQDAVYLREKKPHNLLRWDLDVKAGTTGEKALPIEYSFKVELDKHLMIGGFQTK